MNISCHYQIVFKLREERVRTVAMVTANAAFAETELISSSIARIFLTRATG